MKTKLSILIALVMAISLCLAPAVAQAAVPPSPPTIDGVATLTEWQEATVIQVADSMGTVKVIAYPDYLYVLFTVTDSTDARLGENSVGNDQTGFNVNPTAGANWGKPYGLVFQTGADPAAFTTPDPDVDSDSSGMSDDWYTEWVIDGELLLLPEEVETKTIYNAGTRTSEWKLPLVSEAGATLKVGGAIDVGDGNSYVYPVGLDWNDPATFTDILVQNATSVEAVTVIPPDLIQISITPTTLNFGEVYRGASSASLPLEIANTGSVPVNVSTSTGSAFYQAALTIDGVSVVTWNDTIASPGSIFPSAQVTVPSDWASGIETGTIIFWAEAK